ncbi:MAG: N-acetyltransferase [Verrucomicrobiae bacterium]|nr:N-acetyltransferase [Verrucomicrobiae bacterium]NNJ42510.1 N-acetyltransferase [Akkermansiaceae bacterium]
MNNQIHPTSVISPRAELGGNVTVGPFSIIHAGVEIGANSEIGSHCEIGLPSKLADNDRLSIGEHSLIRSHCVFYIGSTFGEKLVTGHHVTVRENTQAGCCLQLGTRGDIQGHCQIGDYLKTHSHVHIGQKSKIGSYVWMFPDVLLTNDPNPPSELLLGPIVGNFAVLAAKSTLLPGVNIGIGSVVGAQSLVGVDVPDGMLASGSPAKIVGPASILRMRDNPGVKVYPWNKRFHNGYPEQVVNEWK